MSESNEDAPNLCQRDSPVKIGPKSKRQKFFCDFHKCIICQQSKTYEKLSKASSAGISSIQHAANICKDDIYIRLFERQREVTETLASGETDIHYHRKCFQTYTSKSNLQHVKCIPEKFSDTPQESGETAEDGFQPVRRNSRTSVPHFDWSTCIICLKKSHKKDNRLIRIETKEREAILKQAAERQRDESMLLRVTVEDLIAKNAVYHSACFSTYVTSTTAKSNVTRGMSDHENAFKQLIDVIHEDLLKNKKAFLLSKLLELYRSFLPSESRESYTSYHLQSKLLR